MATQPTLFDFLAVAERVPAPVLVPNISQKSFKSSPQQERLFTWVKTGRGNAIVVAVAGSGKTTTLLGKADDSGNTLLPGAVDFMNGSVAVVAFGKKNAQEFDARLTARGVDKKRIRSGTAHSFGFSAWRWANKGVRVAERNGAEKWDLIVQALQIPEQFQSFVRSLIRMAKQRAIGVLCPIDSQAAYYDIVDHFDMAYELAEENEYGTGQDPEQLIQDGVNWAIKALRYSNSIGREIVDFDDMPYLPLVFNCRIWANDWLLVDEAQDTNPCRRALYRRMLKPGGRAIFVGDPAQAIYGFTGADNDSLDLIKNEFHCTELPLTVTYRCPKAVVQLAKTWVNHIEAHDSNIEGQVYSVQMVDFIKQTKELNKQDAILCRNTKPLVELAFSLIRAGVPCHVEGKEIGRGLISLTKRWQVRTIDALRNRLGTFLERETRKLMAKGKEDSAAALTDRVETVLVIAGTMPADSRVSDLRAKIEGMFADTADGKPAINLTLATVHKAKGMEWNDVYLLGRNKYMPSPYARQTWQMEQEDHLCYVAVTRSMRKFVDVFVPVVPRQREAA